MWERMSWADMKKVEMRLATMKGKYDYVVGVLNGGAAIATLAANILEVPLGWVKVSSYENKTRNPIKFEWLQIDPEMAKKRVLIVDDVLDSGETLKFVRLLLSPFTKYIGGFVVHCKRPELARELYVIYGKRVNPDKWIMYPWEGVQKKFTNGMNRRGVADGSVARTKYRRSSG